jgi:hypothetical protein
MEFFFEECEKVLFLRVASIIADHDHDVPRHVNCPCVDCDAGLKFAMIAVVIIVEVWREFL